MSRSGEGWAISRLLTCLAVSAGLHAGLGLANWATPELPARAASHPLQVSLCELTVVATASNTPLSASSPALKTLQQTAATAVKPRPVQQRPKLAAQAAQPVKAETPPADRPEPVVCRSEPVDLFSLAPDAEARPTVSPDVVVDEVVARVDTQADGAATVDMVRLDLTGRLGPDAVPMSLSGSAVGADGNGFVDAQPIYQSNPLPVYPRLARQKRWEGLVWLRVTVSPQGLVTGLAVEESSGYRVLDQAARRAVLGWRFEPARHGDLPVEAKVRVPVRFQLQGT